MRWGRNRLLLLFVCLMAPVISYADVREVAMALGEHWWGVCNSFGTNMPFTVETRGFEADISALNYGGQPASLMLSDRGRVIHCASQSQVKIDKGVVRMSAKDASVTLEQGGDTLPAAYRFACAKYFPPSGRSPDPLFFSAPQYNTWMELTYNQNETDILAYAQSMLDHGLPPGVLMIDDTWQTNYGVWDFDPKKFRDPRGMCDKLHARLVDGCDSSRFPLHEHSCERRSGNRLDAQADFQAGGTWWIREQRVQGRLCEYCETAFRREAYACGGLCPW